jgi:hypothetical protein
MFILRSWATENLARDSVGITPCSLKFRQVISKNQAPTSPKTHSGSITQREVLNDVSRNDQHFILRSIQNAVAHYMEKLEFLTVYNYRIT